MAASDFTIAVPLWTRQTGNPWNSGYEQVKGLDDPKSAGLGCYILTYSQYSSNRELLTGPVAEHISGLPCKLVQLTIILGTDNSQAERNSLRNAVEACQACPLPRQWVGCASNDTRQYRVSAWCRDLVETLQFDNHGSCFTAMAYPTWLKSGIRASLRSFVIEWNTLLLHPKDQGLHIYIMFGLRRRNSLMTFGCFWPCAEIQLHGVLLPVSDRSAIVFVEPMPSSKNYKPCDPKLKFKPPASWLKEPWLKVIWMVLYDIIWYDMRYYDLMWHNIVYYAIILYISIYNVLQYNII